MSNQNQHTPDTLDLLDTLGAIVCELESDCFHLRLLDACADQLPGFDELTRTGAQTSLLDHLNHHIHQLSDVFAALAKRTREG